jgi:hypothetical protein
MTVSGFIIGINGSFIAGRSWEKVRKYRFKNNHFVRSAGLIEFYDKPGNLLFSIDTSRPTKRAFELLCQVY